jgi:hypothetical protein
LLQGETLRNIRPAFTTTVYAFLNPGRPSAARDFFCLKFGVIVGASMVRAAFRRWTSTMTRETRGADVKKPG